MGETVILYGGIMLQWTSPYCASNYVLGTLPGPGDGMKKEILEDIWPFTVSTPVRKVKNKQGYAKCIECYW